ncbi:hypothetical protein JG688_00013343 [Phytophthora aleatoria]|uniref:Uncharacterized protein n=1 Tax=Phytophthora aleatoria TaxID=2496075 RepID=A0A8J5I9U5_9STRA|nr:hypothetical protein JG688_00013343 [Phytophthora aleatoria]
MDGAAYHKRMTNVMPTTKSLSSWLQNYLNQVANLVYNRAATRRVLVILAKLNKPTLQTRSQPLTPTFYPILRLTTQLYNQ